MTDIRASVPKRFCLFDDAGVVDEFALSGICYEQVADLNLNGPRGVFFEDLRNRIRFCHCRGAKMNLRIRFVRYKPSESAGMESSCRRWSVSCICIEEFIPF